MTLAGDSIAIVHVLLDFNGADDINRCVYLLPAYKPSKERQRPKDLLV